MTLISPISLFFVNYLSTNRETAQNLTNCNEIALLQLVVIPFAGRTMTGISFTERFRAGFSGYDNAMQMPSRRILSTLRYLRRRIPHVAEPVQPESGCEANGHTCRHPSG